MLTSSHDDPTTEERQIAALLEQSPRGLIVVAAADASIEGELVIRNSTAAIG